MSGGFDWGEYLALAEAIVGTPINLDAVSDNARSRCALSRAYYAVAMIARSQLAERGTVFSNTGRVHSEIVAALNANPSRSSKRAAKLLRELRQRRNQADYDDQFDATRYSAWILQTARICVELITKD